MKKLTLLFIAILLFSFQGMAQKEITVLTNSKVVGKNLLTGDSIVANEYSFPERVHDFQIDFGTPFIASFDINTGDQNQHHQDTKIISCESESCE